MRKIFLRSALLQRHQMFCAYADMYHKIRQFLTSADHMYEEYIYLCARNKVEAKPSLDVESIVPVSYTHLDVYKRQDITGYDILFSTKFCGTK